MSDGAPTRDSGVFGGLDAFDDGDASVDPDAMDRIMLNLAAASDPPDWHLDALTPDFYPNYSSLPLHYIDPNSPLPPPPPSTPAVPKQTNSQHQQPSTSTPSPSSDNDVQDPRPATTTTTTTTTITTTVPSPKKSKSKHPSQPPLQSPPIYKPRVPTAICTLCGKSISTNGANFRRHEQACRRQRASTHPPPSAARPPSSPFVPPQSQTQTTPPPVLSRRDSDLLNVVRRLENSIGTLDVSARLCLRDALLSLSNKASNPHVPPTPEQEAMNRAAEYLVLRMLFLSGQQVMHTAPGTAGPPYPGPQPTPSSTHPPAPAATRLQAQAARDAVLRSPSGPADADDGTVAASTGTGGPTVPKQQPAPVARRSPLRQQSAPKMEDKLADGT